MGNCTSTLDCQAKAHSDTIDKEIENNSKDIRKECKIIGGGVFPMMPRSSRSSVVSLYKQNTQALNCPTFSTVVLNDGLRWSRRGVLFATAFHLRLIVNSLMLTTPHLFLPLQAQANPETRQ
jgi:hypothetical protein